MRRPFSVRAGLPALALAVVVALSACALSRAQYDEIIEECRRCEPGDTCVLGGGASCVCPVPVNALHEARADQAGDDLACPPGVAVDCPAWDNLRCEASRCTGENG